MAPLQVVKVPTCTSTDLEEAVGVTGGPAWSRLCADSAAAQLPLEEEDVRLQVPWRIPCAVPPLPGSYGTARRLKTGTSGPS